MIIEHDLVWEIRFEYIKGTSGDDLFNRYEFITGTAFVSDEKKEGLVPVGKIEAYFFDIEGSDVPVAEILDSIDGDTSTLMEYFDDDINVVNIEVSALFNIGDAIDDLNRNFIYFHMLIVDKKFRGNGIGKLLIQATLNDIKRDASFAFLNAVPLQFRGSGKNYDEALIAKTDEEFKKRNEEESKKKLIELYKSCGFKSIKPLDGTDMVAFIAE